MHKKTIPFVLAAVSLCNPSRMDFMYANKPGIYV
jgi:uncharacterized protein YdaL